MDSLLLPNVLDDLCKFYTSGKFADFEINCQGYVFEVHKVIICASSKFFQTLCGGSFRVSMSQKFSLLIRTPLIGPKEANQNSANLDDNPIMLARLIQSCYTGDYGSAKFENVLPAVIENALCLGRMRGFDVHHHLQNDSSGCVLHAKMYSLSDKYDVGSARILAVAKFKARISAEEVTSDEVLAATKIIYDTTARNDDILRKHVVYYAQTNMLEILKKPTFQELMADPDFAWDFGTKYASRAHVWCSECLDWTKISVVCGCGFSQLCGASEACKTQDWLALKCCRCKKQGQLLRDEPNDNDDSAMLGARRVGKNGNGQTTPPPTPKKRKH